MARFFAALTDWASGPKISDDALRSAHEANERGVPALVDIEIEKHDYHPHFVEIHKAAISG